MNVRCKLTLVCLAFQVDCGKAVVAEYDMLKWTELASHQLRTALFWLLEQRYLNHLEIDAETGAISFFLGDWFHQ